MDVSTPTATRSGLLSAMSLSGVSQPQTIRYVYDGDGNLVLSIVDDVRTYYPGKHYDRQVSGSATIIKKYYSLNGQIVAVRTVQGSTDTLNWILNDHLGSTSITAAADGSKVAELRYSAFGEIRFSSGTTPTGYQFTGQLNAEAGLIFYNARFYDTTISHFVQVDKVVPNTKDSVSYDRYSYVRNNPIRYIDPKGQKFEESAGVGGIIKTSNDEGNGGKQQSTLEALDIRYPLYYLIFSWNLLTTPAISDNNLRAPKPTDRDMTSWLTDRLNENSYSLVCREMNTNFKLGPTNSVAAMKVWIALVRGGGIWDFKQDIRNSKVADENDQIILGGHSINYQAIANIHYGYVGRAAGLSTGVLEWGAGGYQIYQNGFAKGSWYAVGSIGSKFDDPADNYWVDFGAWLYDQHPNGVLDVDIVRGLDTYIQKEGNYPEPLQKPH